MVILGYSLALVIGLSLGMLGGGGSILTVPLFVYVLGYDPKLAIAMSFPVVGITSLFGAVRQWRAGSIQISKALFFGAFAMTSAFFAGRAARVLDGQVRLTILAVVMLLAAASMFRSASRNVTPVENGAPPAWLTLAVVGLGVGALTGLVGIGGGFLIVPALVLLGRMTMKEAVGTSMLVIAMNSAGGFLGQQNSTIIPWTFVITFVAIAIVGLLAGTRLANKVDQRTLKRVFAVLLVLIASFQIWQSRSLL